MRIIVLGYIVRGPLGGLAWHHFQYVLGLRLMGHDVYFVEDSDDYPACYNPELGVTSEDPSYGLNFISTLFSKFGINDRWVYYDAHLSSWLGPCREKISEICKTADIIFNISGVNPLREWFQNIPYRVLIDTDPVFTQIRHLTDKKAMELARQHNSFFTFAEKINDADCLIPKDGFNWKPTRQPIVLDVWQKTPGNKFASYTTVMQWDSYKEQTYNGFVYGMKSLSFKEFMYLPQKTTETLELALGSVTAPNKLLKSLGWHIINPLEVTKTPWRYQQYISESKAEFSIAKHGYVAAKTGWFSERSACYMAAGRPVVTQDTGFSELFEANKGLFVFSSPDEVTEIFEEINLDYSGHCNAARELVGIYFNSYSVLENLIGNIKDSNFK